METTNTSSTQTQFPAEPDILSANTFRWTPASSADYRRRREKKTLDKIEEYFRAIGLKTERVAYGVRGESADGQLYVSFSYRESCLHVYKTLYIEKSGKKSNITALRKYVQNLTK